jgi:hypothetical protein
MSATMLTALIKTALITTAGVLLSLSILDMVFILFSVDIITLLVANWLWKD